MDARPAGIVLAGGGGRRLGGPKAQLLVGGMTLVERAVTTLLERCAHVVAVTRRGLPAPVVSARLAHDRPGPDAPLVGLATGLAEAAEDEVLVLACDLPLAGAALDVLLRGASGRARVAATGGRPQPLCARYPREPALAAAERLLARGRLRLDGLLEELAPELVDVPPPALLNVNTPADLARARRALDGPEPPSTYRKDAK